MDNQINPQKILESYNEITKINCIQDNIAMFELFEKQFLILFPNQEIPESTTNIYLFNDDGFDIPHIMIREEVILEEESVPKGKYRWVCLYEQEARVNYIISYEDKIKDAISRLIELLSMNVFLRVKEFQKEFMYYWNSSAKLKSLIVYIKQQKNFSEMKVYCKKNETRLIEHGLDLSDIDGRDGRGKRIWERHVENEAYLIPIKDCREILPPHRGSEWTIDHIKKIIYGNQINHIDINVYNCIKNKIVKTQNVIVVFTMQINHINIVFSVKIKCKNITNRTLIQKICDDAVGIELINTQRQDYSYLCEQIGNDQALNNKKVLVVGSGSLGSYVSFELAKNGISQLTIYDNDILVQENLMRWVYSSRISSGINKSIVTSSLLQLLHPEIKVTSVVDNITESTLIEESQKVDLIIFTIGTSDSQLKFNRILKDNGCKTPVIYTWIEAGGEFSHIFIVNYKEKGCYQCLFTNYNNELVNNRASRNSIDFEDRNIVRNGCGGTRAAYGTAVILRTVSTLLNVVEGVINQPVIENKLIDILPDRIEYPSDIVPMKGCKCCGENE